jgi:hypothetical protein
MLLRVWGIMGLLCCVLVVAEFVAVLYAAGWHPVADVSVGVPLHHAYLQATMASFAAIVFCRLGTAFAARTERGLIPRGRLDHEPHAARRHRRRTRLRRRGGRGAAAAEPVWHGRPACGVVTLMLPMPVLV